jgi:hypothetical protein
VTIQVTIYSPAVHEAPVPSPIVGKSGSTPGSRGYRYLMPLVPFSMLVPIRMLSW